MKRLLDKLRSVPHLFAKGMVFWCVGCGTAACFWALRILSHTGQDPAGLLGVILAFFGGELALMCLKTILKTEKSKKQELSTKTDGFLDRKKLDR